MRVCFANLAALIFVSMTLLPRLAAGEVTMKREAAVVEHRIFDPDHPPKEMPKLQAGEAAETESIFHCQVGTSFHLLSKLHREGHCVATAKVDSVHVTLQLKVIIWLPADANEKLKAHEEGHRRIAEQIYGERAEKAGRAAADKIANGRFTGEAETCDAAGQKAVQAASAQASREYLDETGTVSSRIGEIYDQITRHGTNRISEDRAIRRAFDRQAREAEEKAKAGEGEAKTQSP